MSASCRLLINKHKTRTSAQAEAESLYDIRFKCTIPKVQASSNELRKNGRSKLLASSKRKNTFAEFQCHAQCKISFTRIQFCLSVCLFVCQIQLTICVDGGPAKDLSGNQWRRQLLKACTFAFRCLFVCARNKKQQQQ